MVNIAHFRPEDYVLGDMKEFKMGYRGQLVQFLQYTQLLHQFHRQQQLLVLPQKEYVSGHGSIRDLAPPKRELSTVSLLTFANFQIRVRYSTVKHSVGLYSAMPELAH